MASSITKAFFGVKAAQRCCSRFLSMEASAAKTGVSFELSDEQKEFQSLARKFAREEILLKAAHHDKTGEFPWDIVKKAWEIGLLNLSIPAKYGGPELDCFGSCLCVEEFTYACSGIALALTGTELGVGMHALVTLLAFE